MVCKLADGYVGGGPMGASVLRSLTVEWGESKPCIISRVLFNALEDEFQSDRRLYNNNRV